MTNDQYQAKYIRLLNATLVSATVAFVFVLASLVSVLAMKGQMPVAVWVPLLALNFLVVGKAVADDARLRFHMTFGPIAV